MNIFSRRNRAAHLGRYPMEKIKRVDKPTTYISDDVKRVPKRANFFTRAAMGDLGKKAQHERKFRFAKTPLSAALRAMSKTHDDIHDGPDIEEIAHRFDMLGNLLRIVADRGLFLGDGSTDLRQLVRAQSGCLGLGPQKRVRRVGVGG